MQCVHLNRNVFLKLIPQQVLKQRICTFVIHLGFTAQALPMSHGDYYADSQRQKFYAAEDG